MHIEQKASGIDLFQRMKDEAMMVFEVERNTDKVFRANNNTSYLEIYGLYVVNDLPNVTEFIGEFEQFPNAKITHRLDMATSGILMFAKHRDAEVAVSKMFQARTVKKNYIALVQGKLPDTGRIEVPLITDWENRPRQIVHFELGKPALTLYDRVEYDEAKDVSRVLLTPITGRSHQLRVHLQYIGHPITGDKLYHPQPTRSPLGRMALHASYLAFTQPLSGVELEIVCEAAF